MKLSTEQKEILNNIRNNLLTVFDKFSAYDFNDFNTILQFFHDYAPLAAPLGNILDKFLSDSGSDCEPSPHVDNNDKIQIAREIQSIVFDESVKKKCESLFIGYITNLDYSKSITTRTEAFKYNEPAMTIEKYRNNPAKREQYIRSGMNITLYDKIDRTVKKFTETKEIYKIQFSDNTVLTFGTLKNAPDLERIKEQFDDKIRSLSNNTLRKI